MQRRNPARFQPAEGDSLNDMLRKYFEKVRFRKNKRQAAISRDALARRKLRVAADLGRTARTPAETP